MSGWQKERMVFELTPTKARFYQRRALHLSPGDVMVLHGLKGVVETSWGGWEVKATVAQIWTALSGQPSGVELFRHEGREQLIAAGVYSDEEYMRLCLTVGVTASALPSLEDEEFEQRRLLLLAQWSAAPDILLHVLDSAVKDYGQRYVLDLIEGIELDNAGLLRERQG